MNLFTYNQTELIRQNTKIFDLCKNKLDLNLNERSVQCYKTDLVEVCPITKPCFLLHNLLSKDECKTIIQIGETLTFDDAESYCHMYRDRLNDRILTDDPELANFLFERAKPFLPSTGGECRLRSFPFNDFTNWKVSKLNCRFRFCRYKPGHFFGAHTDGSFRENADESTLFSLTLYLNDDFEGGELEFIDHKTKEIKYKFKPIPGTAAIFLQEDIDTLHRGCRVINGLKYLLRTDIVYTNLDN
eukprot:TRINITY_DN5371_c0_g2_i2.p1 TRINITY_DN5371_c0_g2~~TRINITY_DN5371_c0_g2_i2.p1  ORF type:complete len:244 (-),score=70.41 TRINITY_DN5371_c0_g2_i2:286-1017(-)